MTPEDKAYYSDGYQPLFDLMVNEHGLLLLEGEMIEIINCVRKMDEAGKENPPFISGEHPQDAKVISPIVLECIVTPETKTFTYYDISEKKIAEQFVSMGRIKIYCPNVDYAIKAIGKNKGLILSYKIECNKLIVGQNFNY